MRFRNRGFVLLPYAQATISRVEGKRVTGARVGMAMSDRNTGLLRAIMEINTAEDIERVGWLSSEWSREKERW